MADTKISALSAATALAGTEAIPVVQSAATVKATPAQVLTYVCGNATPITITGGTVTTSSPVVNSTQTWNAGGVTFTGIKLNVTDTASASGSLLMDLQVGGSSRFSVTKGGALTALSAITTTNGPISAGDAAGLIAANSNAATLTGGTAPYLKGRSEFTIQWSSTGSYAGASDVGLARVAAGVLKVTNGSSGAGVLQLPVFTVATLPAAATAGAGARASVSDSLAAPVYNSAAVGGGSTFAGVVSSGSAWLYG